MEAQNFSFSLESPQRDQEEDKESDEEDEKTVTVSKIQHFYRAPTLIKESWLHTYFYLSWFDSVHPRDLGIAILEKPISCVTPMELHLDPLNTVTESEHVLHSGGAWSPWASRSGDCDRG